MNELEACGTVGSAVAAEANVVKSKGVGASRAGVPDPAVVVTKSSPELYETKITVSQTSLDIKEDNYTGNANRGRHAARVEGGGTAGGFRPTDCLSRPPISAGAAWILPAMPKPPVSSVLRTNLQIGRAHV